MEVPLDDHVDLSGFVIFDLHGGAVLPNRVALFLSEFESHF
jgi:hypothetical protein